MTTKIKNYLSFAVLLFFFGIGIASSPKNGTYSDADKWIPANFDPRTTILLIEEHPLGKKQNDRMNKFLEDKYPYQYQIISGHDRATKKYDDPKKYPFMIYWTTSTNSYVTGNAGGGMTHHHSWNMYGHFLDNVSGKTYPATSKNNVYGQIGYRAVFNSIVKKYKNL